MKKHTRRNIAVLAAAGCLLVGGAIGGGLLNARHGRERRVG